MTKNARWDATIAELQVGFRYNKQHEEYQCLFCEQTFSKGVIYPYHELLLEAQKAIELHIRTQHESPFNQLIQMDKRYTGISEQQRDTLKYFYDGLDDKKIAEIVGGSPSTIRNYRFKLKEKEKQAKVFLVLMALSKNFIILDRLMFCKDKNQATLALTAKSVSRQTSLAFSSTSQVR